MAAVLCSETLTARQECLRSRAPLWLAAIAVFIRSIGLFRSDLGFALLPDDSFEYLELARGMLHGCGFARLLDGACESPEILRTPGYPLLLTTLPDTRWIIAAQALLAGVTCWLVATWVRRRWSPAAAVLAEAVVAFDLPSIVMANAVMPETLFQLAVVLAVVPGLMLATRPRHDFALALTTGIAGACAILVRPIAILFPLIGPIPYLAIPSLNWRRRLALASLAASIPALALVGWAWRNYQRAGFAGLSTVGAINLYYYRAADVAARERGARLEAMRAPFGRRLGVSYEHIYEADVQSAALTERMERLAMEQLMRRPLGALAMTAQSSVYLALTAVRSPLARLLGIEGWSAGNGLNAGAPSLTRFAAVVRKLWRSPLLAVLVVAQLLITLAIWVGVGRALSRCLNADREYRLWTLYLTGTAILLLVLAAGGEASARFRVPAIPLLGIVAALGYLPGGGFHARAEAMKRGGRLAIATRSPRWKPFATSASSADC
jgi:hypothetical protein